MVRAEGDVVVLDFRLSRSLFPLFGEELSPPLVHQQHGEQRPSRLAIEGAGCLGRSELGESGLCQVAGELIEFVNGDAHAVDRGRIVGRLRRSGMARSGDDSGDGRGDDKTAQDHGSGTYPVPPR